MLQFFCLHSMFFIYKKLQSSMFELQLKTAYHWVIYSRFINLSIIIFIKRDREHFARYISTSIFMCLIVISSVNLLLLKYLIIFRLYYLKFQISFFIAPSNIVHVIAEYIIFFFIKWIKNMRYISISNKNKQHFQLATYADGSSMKTYKNS